MTESDSLLNRLLCKRFPILANLSAGSSTVTPSPEDVLEIESYRHFLEELSQGELKEYARRCHGEDSEEIEARRPFNQPYAFAEFDHWTRQALWSLDDTCALFLGRDPDLVKYGFVRSMAPSSRFAREYCSLRQTLERAQIANILHFPSQPKLLLDWALAVEYPLPGNLVSLLERRRTGEDWWRNALDESKRQIATLEATNSDRGNELESLREALSVLKDLKKQEVGSRERTTLYTMIIAMAIDGYGYDPRAERSPTSQRNCRRCRQTRPFYFGRDGTLKTQGRSRTRAK